MRFTKSSRNGDAGRHALRRWLPLVRIAIETAHLDKLGALENPDGYSYLVIAHRQSADSPLGRDFA